MKKKMLAFATMVVANVLCGPAWGQAVSEFVSVPKTSLDTATGRVRKVTERVGVLEGAVTAHGERLGKLEEARKKAPVVAPASAAPPASPAPVVAPPVSPPTPPPAPLAGDESVIRDMLREYAGARYARILDPRRTRAEVAVAKNNLATVVERGCRSRSDSDACREINHALRLADLRLNADELAPVLNATVVPPPEPFVETYGGQCLIGGTLGAVASGVVSATAGNGRGKARDGARDAATTALVTAGVTGVLFALADGLGDVRHWGGKSALAAGCAAGGGMAVAGGDWLLRPRRQQKIVIATPVR